MILTVYMHLSSHKMLAVRIIKERNKLRNNSGYIKVQPISYNTIKSLCKCVGKSWVLFDIIRFLLYFSESSLLLVVAESLSWMFLIQHMQCPFTCHILMRSICAFFLTSVRAGKKVKALAKTSRALRDILEWKTSRIQQVIVWFPSWKPISNLLLVCG